MYMYLYFYFPFLLPELGGIWCKGFVRHAGGHCLINLCIESRTSHRGVSDFLPVNFTLVFNLGEIVCK